MKATTLSIEKRGDLAIFVAEFDLPNLFSEGTIVVTLSYRTCRMSL